MLLFLYPLATLLISFLLLLFSLLPLLSLPGPEDFSREHLAKSQPLAKESTP